MAISTCKNCGLPCVLESVGQKPQEHKLCDMPWALQFGTNLPFQLSSRGQQAFPNFTSSGLQAMCAAILCLKDSISLETQLKRLQHHGATSDNNTTSSRLNRHILAWSLPPMSGPIRTFNTLQKWALNDLATRADFLRVRALFIHPCL